MNYGVTVRTATTDSVAPMGPEEIARNAVIHAMQIYDDAWRAHRMRWEERYEGEILAPIDTPVPDLQGTWRDVQDTYKALLLARANYARELLRD